MAEQPAARTGFAAQLRRLRLRAGLTQEALAEKAGLSVTTIGAIEEGQRRRPYPHTLRALADSLELNGTDRAALMSPSVPAPDEAEDGVSAALQIAMPVPPTALIGREPELAAVRALLLPLPNTAGVRLLTLLGPGGVGKTRLSLEIAATLRGTYVDGAAFVDLAPLRDHRLVPVTIARALGVRESGGRSAWDLLLMHLRSRRVLLVLDNFEHMVGAAPLLNELLGACPGVALLVTSRTALRVRGEHRMAIGPLATPAADERPPVAEVAAYPAVRLFVDRVREVTPEFSLDDSNVAVVAEICRQLDGMPLALELAAARTQLLPPAALLQRMDHRLHLLSSGPVDLPERQRTLRNTLAWSYDLLEAQDQSVFGRLAVFAGGWTLGAAEAVCADADVPSGDVLQQLGALIDSSLILVRRLDESGAEPRFGMHEMIREYALERVQAAGEEAQVRDRHLAYWLGVAEAAGTALDGPDQRVWLDRLERDHDNLRAALTWSAQGGAPVAGLRLASALLFFWFLRGHLREGRYHVQTALDAAGAAADPWTRGRGLAALGHLLLAQGESAEARARLESALTIAREVNDGAGAAFALRYLGILASAGADDESARGFLEESLALARREGVSVDVAMALAYLGDLALRHDDVDSARGLFEECTDVLRELRNNMLLAYPLRRLGLLAHLRGDIPLAVRLCVESVERNRIGGERLSVAASLVTLARIADTQGQPACGVQLLSKASALASSIGGQMLPFEARQFESAMLELRDQLEPAVWARAWDAGRELSLDEAVLMVEELAHSAPAVPAAEITPRQREILRLLGAGQTNREIAAALALSVATIERHLANLYARIGARGRADATVYAVRVGLVSPDRRFG